MVYQMVWLNLCFERFNLNDETQFQHRFDVSVNTVVQAINDYLKSGKRTSMKHLNLRQLLLKRRTVNAFKTDLQSFVPVFAAEKKFSRFTALMLNYTRTGDVDVADRQTDSYPIFYWESGYMISSVIASWTLFFGLLMISAGNGLQNVLLGTRAPEIGFSNIATGFVMSGYYIGIFLGSISVPNILAGVGHVRVFGAMSAIASAAVLIHIAFGDPILWALMRLASGFGFAGMYIVCESWLNDKATNETGANYYHFI